MKQPFVDHQMCNLYDAMASQEECRQTFWDIIAR